MKKILSLILTFAIFTAMICSFGTVHAETTAPVYDVRIYDDGDGSVEVKVFLPTDVDVYSGNTLFTYNTSKLTLITAKSLISGVVNPNYIDADEGITGGIMHTYASTGSYGKGTEIFVMTFNVAEDQTFTTDDITYERFQMSSDSEIISDSKWNDSSMDFNKYYEVTFTDANGSTINTDYFIEGTTEFPAQEKEGFWFEGFADAPSVLNACASITCNFVAYGDVNRDGNISPLDASLILQYNAKLINTLKCIEVADVNLDGKISPLDASLVLQFDARLIDKLPATK